MTPIDWIPPEPRQGWDGAWDKFIGPGATKAELWVQLGGGMLLAAAILLFTFPQRTTLGWSFWQWLVVGLLAVDLSGGIITNATAAAKRWYHRPGQGFWAHLSFIAVHGFHLAVVAWLFREGDWLFFVVTYGYLLAAAILILRVPLYLSRPLAFLCMAGSILISQSLLTPTPGLTWFLPFFYLKLLLSHLLKEAPFSPEVKNG